MAIPNVHLSVLDGALGLAPVDASGIIAFVGACSQGTVEQVYTFSDVKTLHETLGFGPLVEAAALALVTGGGPVRCVRVNGSIAGVATAVDQPAGGTSGVVGTTGAPYDDYDVIIEILEEGAVATATFRYSLDGGTTWSAEILTAATYEVLGTGLTLTFAAGSYVEGETYTFTTTAPDYSDDNLKTAFDELAGSPLAFEAVFAVGQAANVAASKARASKLDSLLTAQATDNRYAYGIVEAADDTDGNIASGFASFVSVHVVVAAGMETLPSVITSRRTLRSIAWRAAARLSAIAISVDAGRYADGPLPGVTELDRDERVTPALDELGFLTLRTFQGRPGAYVTNGNIKALPTSDYKRLVNRRVINRGSAVTYEALLQYLNDSVRVNPESGFIDERDAAAIEAYVGGLVEAALVVPGHASSAQVLVKRDENILSTENLTVDIRVVPLGYVRAITATIGLRNPALAAA